MPENGVDSQNNENGQNGRQNPPPVVNQAIEIRKHGQLITLTPISVLTEAGDYNR